MRAQIVGYFLASATASRYGLVNVQTHQAIAETLGIRRVHWHALRHLNNSLMLNEGVDVATRMDRLGHVTDRVNLIYSHSGDAAQLAASGAIERRLEAARVCLEKERRAAPQGPVSALNCDSNCDPNVTQNDETGSNH